MKPLEHYLHKFRQLKVASNKEKGKAPHKPVLLLALMDNIEQGLITDNRITIDPVLVATFLEIWSMLVISDHYKPNFALPFFHLKGDTFWKLVNKPGVPIAVTSSGSIKSFSALKGSVEHAEVDAELWEYMNDPVKREALRKVLLDTWFPHTKHVYLAQRKNEGRYLQSITHEVLQEPTAQYTLPIATGTEEEQFIRDRVFTSTVITKYDHTCCITGMRIISPGITMVDACHIIPFSETTASSYGRINSITNGISLCPNLHRAFDRHLISISDDYQVIIKKEFAESQSDYSLRKLEGKTIILPREQKYWPAKENLEWHRKYGVH